MAERQRLDAEMTRRGLVTSRSQAENWIKLGDVRVNGTVQTKAGYMVDSSTKIELAMKQRYVSRAGLKLASVADIFGLDFRDKIVLDVGSSTGGFTDYALQHGAKKVFAVDVGTEQLHPSLRGNTRIELHEKTDIRDFVPSEMPNIVVMDVSFISLRQILPHVFAISGPQTQIVAMVKPQFEAERKMLTKNGIVKNDKMRRQILADFEAWAKQSATIVSKRDSDVAGTHGNLERFYVLRKLATH